MSRNTTLADVARLAGVSKTSASLALNATPGARLAPATVRRVRDAAESLGYRPDPVARGLRLGTTRTVSLVSDEVITTRYASAMITGALDVAHATQHTLLLSEVHGDPDRVTEALEVTLDRRADGVVFAVMAARLVELPPLLRHVRVVMLNAVGTHGEPAVLPAEFDAGAAVADELLTAGHRRVALVGVPPAERLRAVHTVTVGTRLAGIREAFRRAGVEPALTLEAGDWEPDVGHALARRALADPGRVTALLCLNDRLAFGAYQAVLEAGLRIPDDVSVVSFDDDEVARYLRPGLTTARIPYEEMGRRAMTLLLEGETPEAPVLVPMPLARRGSVGPPAR